MKNYKRRILDSMLEKKLQAKGAVLIEGPKWCGKTTTAEEIAASKIMLAKPDIKDHFKSLLEIDSDAALGLGPADLINDLNSMGFFFEAMCVRDLRVFAEALNGKVYHYRDKSGLECDAVVHLRNGQYGLIEIKLGGDSLIKEGAETLNELANQIDTTRMKSPAFKMILTATGEYAYRRTEDGIYVVPIGCLKP